MSYEGREIYLCSNGHLMVRDCFEEGKPPKTCPFCNTKYKHVGGIDDTNGDAASDIKLKCIEKEERKQVYEKGVMTLTLKPARYTVVQSKGVAYNFDTGKKLPEYLK